MNETYMLDTSVFNAVLDGTVLPVSFVDRTLAFGTDRLPSVLL